jgi:hypothetical protein
VIQSDEVYVVLGDQAGSVWVTQTANGEYDEACVVPKFKQSNLHLRVWFCIMKNKKGPIIILEYLGGARRWNDKCKILRAGFGQSGSGFLP